MAGSLNKAMLIGHLGVDPERFQRNDGPVSCSFRLATSETWRDKQTGERREKTEWHNVKIFNENLAKVALDYLRKGSKVYVEGQIQTRKWQHKDGTDRYSTEIVLQAFGGVLTLLDGRDKDSGENGRGDDRQSTGTAGSGSGRPRGHDLDDDIPFAPEAR